MALTDNISSDDAAIFSDNTMADFLTHDPIDDSQQEDDPDGPKGQSRVNKQAMFRPFPAHNRPRRIKTPSSFPTGIIPNLTPGARTI